jgi:hypothetical protein
VVAPDKGKRTRRSEKRRANKLRVVRSDDPGPPYVVRWHPEAVEERDASWPPGEKVAMEHAVEKLQATGPRLKHPHSSAVRGSAGRGLRELRPRAGRSRWRPLYRQVTPDTFVILAVGPDAQIDRSAFNAAVGRATKRFAELDTA